MTPLRADMFEEICPSTLVPIRLSDKWAPLVLRCLEEGPRRFSELRVPIRASAKALTTLGQSLLVQLDTWCEWAAEHWDELLDARDPVS